MRSGVRRPSLDAILLILFAGLLPVVVHGPLRWWEDRAGERQVAAMDGIGPGWVDTLRRVVFRDIVVDTMIDAIRASYGEGNILGMQEGWYARVRVNTDLSAYMRFAKNVCGFSPQTGFTGHFGYTHPAWLAYPAAVIAHEFGHQYQLTLPETSMFRNWPTEIFADRFASAMLQLRGWLPPDTTDTNDARLRHELRFRLLHSYWVGGEGRRNATR